MRNFAISDLDWLAGCWEMAEPEKKRVTAEQWMSAAGGAMIGMSRTIRDGRLESFEYLRIVEQADGVYYISRPSQNRDETAFKFVKSSTTEAVFENPTHDFPQRIIYQLSSTRTLHARIEGKVADKLKAIDFPMTRSNCGGEIHRFDDTPTKIKDKGSKPGRFP